MNIEHPVSYYPISLFFSFENPILAHTDPLQDQPPAVPKQLQLDTFGLTDAEYRTLVRALDNSDNGIRGGTFRLSADLRQRQQQTIAAAARASRENRFRAAMTEAKCGAMTLTATKRFNSAW